MKRKQTALYDTFLKLAATAAKLLQLCPTLCDPIDSSPPGSYVPGVLQARTLEWVAISSPVFTLLPSKYCAAFFVTIGPMTVHRFGEEAEALGDCSHRRS